MNIFDALRDDHETQRTLVGLLVKTHGDSDGRRELFERLTRELAAHAAAEERAFYVALMQHDETQEKARHSVAEHHELDELVERLEGTEMSAPHWLTTARELAERLVHHLDEEEHEVFQMAGKVLTESQKTSLAGDYRDEMERQRTG
jgi:hemerythrin-like domain-containing protein